MKDLRSFLVERAAELKPRLAQAEGEIAKLRGELADIDKAMSALDRGASGRRRRQGAPSEGTIPAQALAVLENGEELHPADIASRIDQRFGRVVSRESLAPQLSRLRQDGLITCFGGRYQRIKQDAASH